MAFCKNVLCVCARVCLSFYLSVCRSIYLYVCLSVCLSVFLSSSSLLVSLLLFICVLLPTTLSVCLCIHSELPKAIWTTISHTPRIAKYSNGSPLRGWAGVDIIKRIIYIFVKVYHKNQLDGKYNISRSKKFVVCNKNIIVL